MANLKVSIPKTTAVNLFFQELENLNQNL